MEQHLQKEDLSGLPELEEEVFRMTLDSLEDSEDSDTSEEEEEEMVEEEEDSFVEDSEEEEVE